MPSDTERAALPRRSTAAEATNSTAVAPSDQAVVAASGHAARARGSRTASVREAMREWVGRDVLLPFAATRLAFTLIGLFALSVLTPGRNAAPIYGFWSMWARMDSGWYLSIARDGYDPFVPGQLSNTGFWPLFPALMRGGAALIGRRDDASLLFVGFVISNLALVVALIYLVLLVRLDFDAATAGRAALYILAFPTTVFLSAVYAESLFLALSVAAFYHARRGQWWVAGVLGGAAALARPHGVLLMLPLALEYLAQRRFDLRAIRPNVLALGLVPVGLGVFLTYLQYRFGDPVIALKAHSNWNQRLMAPWDTFREFFSAPLTLQPGWSEHSIQDLCFTVVFIALVIVSWRVVRPSYAAFATIGLLPPLMSGLLISIPRYGLTLFPVFIVLAVAGRRPWFDRAYVLVALSLAGLFMALFAARYWVA